MKKIIGFVSLLLLACMIFILPVSAKEDKSIALSDGLEFSLLTDQEEYSEGDTVEVTLTVTNKNEYKVEGIFVESFLPENLVLEGGEEKLENVTLDAGESRTLSFSVKATEKNNAIIIVAVVGAVLVLGIIATLVIVLVAKNRNVTDVVSIFLCVMLAFSVFAPMTVSAEGLKMEVERTVEIGKDDYTVSAVLSCEFPALHGSVNINTEGLILDPAKGIYYLFEKRASLGGEINAGVNITKAVYSIADRNGNVILSGEAISSATSWLIDNMKLLVGENTVNISVHYENGLVASSSIRINNLCEDNMAELEVDRRDEDSDGVLNYIENMYSTDPLKADSDEDRLSDYDEMALLNTDPLKKDTDDNGTTDDLEDIDEDGLSNYDEIYVSKTKPQMIDTDADGLSDGEEVNKYKTSPKEEDTDGDGASDYWEVKNNFDPTVKNEDFGELEANGVAKVDEGVEVTIVVNDEFLNEETPGYMGVDPYEVDLGDKESSTIAIPFEKEGLTEEDVPAIYYFNEDTQRLEEVETTVQDGKAQATVEKSGKYILLNRRYVYDVWENDIIKPSKEPGGTIDIAFVIDRSASMDSNDPEGLRKEVVKKFIGKLRPEDKAAIIQFTAIGETIMTLTDNKEALVQAVDGIVNSDGGGCAGSDQNAGTNGKAGLRNALDELTKSSAPNKYIIFLTDGDDTVSDKDAGYTYDQLTAEAKSKGIIIHTVGLVGTGSVNTDILKKIAKDTDGNYYLATSGTEAENVPEDVLGLEDVYSDIESITIDRFNDSNNDGISDYYTQMMCDGKLLNSKGTLVFGSATFEEVQQNADFDGDGLTNGQEIVISETESGVYAKIFSYPDMKDSDRDGFLDNAEVSLGSSPLKYNSAVDKADVQYFTNSENFVSDVYLDFFNDSWLERGSVYIGNAFFGTDVDLTVLYQKALTDYFEAIDQELLNRRTHEKYLEFAKEATGEVVDAFSAEIFAEMKEAQKPESLLEKMYNVFKDVMNKYGAADKYLEFEKLFNKLGDLINFADGTSEQMRKAEATVSEIKELMQYVAANSKNAEETNNFLNFLQGKLMDAEFKVENLNIKMSSNIGKKISKFTKTLKKAGDVLTCVDFVISTYETASGAIKDYCTFIANLEILEENIYILDTIIATTDNRNLSAAASNIKFYALNVRDSKLADGLMKFEYGFNATVKIGLNALHSLIELKPEMFMKIPYIGPVIVALEGIRSFGNAFFNIDEMSMYAVYTVSTAQTADALGKHFRNNIEGGNAIDGGEQWVAYADFSEEIYSYFLNLIEMRKASENYMGHEKFHQPKDTKNAAIENAKKCDSYIEKYNTRLFDYYANA